MPSNIYNEGRVVGYSAYEVYVRHCLSEDPTIEPASETEWLASSLAFGASLLLKVSADSTSGFHWRDFLLPEKTNLCAANTIIGSFFIGEGEFGSYTVGDNTYSTSPWASKVVKYGSAIRNDNTASPSGTISSQQLSSSIPKVGTNPSDDDIQRLGEYAKLVDGNILAPGTWTNSTSGSPKKTFSPDLGDRSMVRLLFADKVEHDFWLLLTGFSLSGVVRGETGIDSSVDTDSPQDGDYLGPATFPWSNKILLSVPPAFLKYYYDSGYIRRINNGPSAEVKSHAIIDMATTNPKTYYEDENNGVSDSQVPLTITKLRIASDDAAILTVYQRSSLFPPALYGVKAIAEADDTSTENKLNPLDTVAPGTLKLFQNLQDADAYEQTKKFETQIPNNFGFYRNTNDFVVKQLDSTLDDKPSVPVADTYTEPFVGSLSNTEAISPYFAAQTNSVDPSGYFFVYNLISRRISGCFSDNFKSDFGYIYTFNMLTSSTQPADWTTDDGKKKYYKLENGGYVKIDDPSSLTYQANTYYLPTEQGQAIDAMEKMSFPSSPGAQNWEIGNGMKSYVISKYPTNWHTKYYFALSIKETRVSGRNIGGITIVPIEMATNKIDFIDKRYGGVLSLPWPLLPDANNIEEAEANYYKIEAGNYTDYLGNYWYTGSGPSLPSSNHQTIQTYIDSVNSSVASVTEPNRKVPANTRTDDAYTDWQDRYANVTLRQLFPQSKVIYDRDTNLGGVSRDMLGAFQYLYKNLRPNGSQQVVSYSGVHSDYWNCTLSEALRYAMFYDTTKSKETGLKPGGFRIPLFFCMKSSTSYDSESGITVNGDLDLTSTIKESSPKTISIPIPAEYRPSTGIQTVVNVAGYHQTKAVSLADADGADYATSGTGGDVSPSDGKIHWDDLLNILANNESIDLLNSETFLKNLMTFLNSHIQSGTGINSTYNLIDNIRTLSLSTRNDSGISIETGTGGTDVESSGKHIVAKVNADKGMACDTYGLYPNFAQQQGTGIEVSVSSSGIVITNTMPDYSNGNYTELEYGTDYTVNSPNHFNANSKGRISVQVAESGDQGTIAIKVMFDTDSDGVHPGNSNFGSSCYIHEYPVYTVQTTQPSDWNTQWMDYYEKVSGVYKKLGTIYSSKPTWQTNKFYTRSWAGELVNSIPEGADANEYHASTTSGHFAFKHTLQSPLACKKANIVNITFSAATVQRLFRETTDGTERRKKYRFEDTTGATSGIWNIDNADRASWSAACGLRGNRTYYKNGNLFDGNELMKSDCDITIVGFSYADGYNSQFPNAYNTTNAKSEHINLEVSGVFRYRG